MSENECRVDSAPETTESNESEVNTDLSEKTHHNSSKMEREPEKSSSHSTVQGGNTTGSSRRTDSSVTAKLGNLDNRDDNQISVLQISSSQMEFFKDQVRILEKKV